MSDLMLTAVLSMPYDMAMGDEFSRRQFWDRAQQALAQIGRLTAERDEHARWRQKLADDLHDRETQIIELRRQLDEAEQDARRYRWIAGHCRSTSEHWGGRWSIIVDGPAPKAHDSEDAFDAAIDAAMRLTRPAEES